MNAIYFSQCHNSFHLSENLMYSKFRLIDLTTSFVKINSYLKIFPKRHSAHLKPRFLAFRIHAWPRFNHNTNPKIKREKFHDSKISKNQNELESTSESIFLSRILFKTKRNDLKFPCFTKNRPRYDDLSSRE